MVDGGILWDHPDLGYSDENNNFIGHIWRNLDEDADGDGDVIRFDEEDGWTYDDEGWNGQNNDGDLEPYNPGQYWQNDLLGYWAQVLVNGHNIGDAVPGDECSHGTRMAGIIGAVTNNGGEFAGIAGGWGEDNPGCTIISAKHGPDFIQNPDYQMTQFEAGMALDYVVNGVVDVHIINMSLSCAGYDRIVDLLDVAHSRCILVCVSSGNHDNPSVGFPANLETTMAVGASYHNRRWSYFDPNIPMQCGTQHGDGLDIVVPTGYEWEDDAYNYLVHTTATEEVEGVEVPIDPIERIDDCHSGATSGACACLSGVSALLMSHHWNEDDFVVGQCDISASEVKEILLTTAQKDNDWARGRIDYGDNGKYGRWDDQMGYGELDAGRALEYGERLEMELESGWSMISSNLIPFYNVSNGLNDEDGIYLIFDELVDEIDILKDYSGNFWKPEWVFCNIPCWDYHQGYYIKLYNDAAWVTLGRRADFDEEIPVPIGWSMVAYFPLYQLGAPDAFVSLWDPEDEEVRFLIIAKNHWGEFYVPDEEIFFNNMRELERGYGYQIKLNQAAILIYPEEMLDSYRGSGRNYAQSTPDHFRFTRTYDFHPVLLTSINVENLNPEEGDEVGVYNADGLCIGASVLNGEHRLGLAVWEDDTTTVEVDGYRERDTFYLRYWDADRNMEIIGDSLNIFSDLNSAGEQPSYSLHDLSIGDPTIVVPLSFTVNHNYPNPFNSETVIRYSIPQSGVVCLRIYDVNGRIIQELFSGRQQAGWHQVSWSGLDSRGLVVSSGIYFSEVRYESPSSKPSTRLSKMLLIR